MRVGACAPVRVCLLECRRARVCACVRACVRACLLVYRRGRVCVCVRACVCLHYVCIFTPLIDFRIISFHDHSNNIMSFCLEGGR